MSAQARQVALNIAVWADGDDPAVQQRAGELGEQLRLPVIRTEDPAFDMILTITDERVELRFPQRGGPGPLYVDFVEGPMGYARRINRFGLIFQAVGFPNHPTVFDATAGLGRDAFRLAYHGCPVTAVEREPIPFVLLQDGLERALHEPDIAEQVGQRLRLVHADAREILRALRPEDAPEVVYIDPMFPPKKKSALVKVEMRILGQLVGDDADAGELFELARAVARQRVVVKRHRHAEPLAPQPSHSCSDKTTRYDVYVRPRPVQPEGG
jgi:16S rRNA (guanine1516-N2)-methyltransferase